MAMGAGRDGLVDVAVRRDMPTLPQLMCCKRGRPGATGTSHRPHTVRALRSCCAYVVCSTSWLRQGRDADDDVYNDFVMPSMRLPIYAAGPTAAERLPAVQAEMNKLKS